MDRNKLILLFHTLKYLKFKQVYFRVFYIIRNKFFKKTHHKQLQSDITPLVWNHSFLNPISYKSENIFTFLNIEHKFDNEIDWNYAEFGKLWTYNLNYFDFLNQEELTSKEGLLLIEDYIQNDFKLKDGKEPYPISLRGINWIKFLSKNNISDNEINQKLYNHYQLLSHNIEYHLLGNHLLENGFSLLFGAYYFQDDTFYKKAKKILLEELKEQVLSDGAHFELSPMYHQILLHRLLDCINLVKSNPWKQKELLLFLNEKAHKMLSWLQAVTYKNGNIPMVNDSAYGIAPKSEQLFLHARNLGLDWKTSVLSDSGYRKIEKGNYELFMDVGEVGPTYQPGHAHSDTFNFELYVNEKPVIVDTGVSTYEKNKQRQLERSTASHNTVQIGDYEQTQVWGGFRVAERAKIINLKESEDQVEATHNGYYKLNIIHTRKFKSDVNQIFIEDIMSNITKEEQIAFIHFHPSVKKINISETVVNLPDQSVKIKFENTAYKIKKASYQYALGFNKREQAIKLKVYFDSTLKTTILL